MSVMRLESTYGGNQMIERLTTIVGFCEGVSALCLFLIAMPMKYLLGEPEMVTIVGTIHGALFVAYLGALMLGVGNHWNSRAFIHGFFAASIPGAPFWFDGQLKSGKYSLAE